MKRLLNTFLVAIALALASGPAFATLAYQYAGTKYGDAELFTAYITATGNDTTDPVNGKVIDNRDGRITHLYCQTYVTNQTGTSPTINLKLEGSNDGTGFAAVYDSGGNAIASGATSISSASSTPVLVVVDTSQEGRTFFPAYLRLVDDLGGTTPGGTYTTSCHIFRRKSRE